MANEFITGPNINLERFPDHADRLIEEAIERPTQVEEQLKGYFHEVTSESDTWTVTDYGSALSTPPLNDDEDSIPRTEPAPGRKVTYTLDSYRHRVSLTDRFLKGDRLGVAMQLVTGLPESVMLLHEYKRAGVFDDSFAAGTYTGSDGLALCSNAHTPEHPLGATMDNLISGTLNYSLWHDMRLLARNMTNERGDPLPLKINTVLIGPSLEKEAEELILVNKRNENPDEVNRATGTTIDSFKIRVSDYIDDTNSPWWGLTNVSGAKRGLFMIYFNGRKMRIDDVRPDTNKQIVWAKSALTDLTAGIGRGWTYVFGSSG